MSGEGEFGGNGSWVLDTFTTLSLVSLKLWVGARGLEVPGTQAYPFSQPCAHLATTAPPSLSTGSFPKATGPGGCIPGPDTGRLDGPLLPEPCPSTGGCPQDPREGAHDPSLPYTLLSPFSWQILELSGE